ncbi:DoxX family membrane protein [Flavobacterium sp. CYK-4]|uniref:DoxX family protein n=1 Tax=Flavobacterium lotistagni TaxID=2709660 RepID=UPI0014079FFE|nr:DoxX family membrane protein [Flavobacterium lotistagni]NHM08174.1 DoxX family membrane protein [Flavobacterium lotistagni]
MKNILLWILRLTAAVILLQTLYFKFTGAEESVYIFSTLGAEPYGRIGSGVIELVASVLILIPRTTWMGALLGLGTMMGAIFSHLFILGIEVQNDGGTLFILAVITWICCALLAFQEKNIIRDWVASKI